MLSAFLNEFVVYTLEDNNTEQRIFVVYCHLSDKSRLVR